jgi:hypothetical protein
MAGPIERLLTVAALPSTTVQVVPKPRSDANGGECVEVASTESAEMVRDTKARSASTLTVTASAWRAFLSTKR